MDTVIVGIAGVNCASEPIVTDGIVCGERATGNSITTSDSTGNSVITQGI